ncbi:hypothetical protein [Succinivibrio dextrinosolvens]|uniref:hypothetical protein n=1 Tax=Succinivibrio dextrinosolvens TaxID=83771 RepID=UPI0004E22142|nr:hypothetical protein [Succinivibrio dextrinosolvens]
MFKRNNLYKSSLEYEPLLPEESAFDSRNEKAMGIFMVIALLICGIGIVFSITFLSYIFFSGPVINLD